jgi:hypothetical protein
MVFDILLPIIAPSPTLHVAVHTTATTILHLVRISGQWLSIDAVCIQGNNRGGTAVLGPVTPNTLVEVQPITPDALVEDTFLDDRKLAHESVIYHMRVARTYNVHENE